MGELRSIVERMSASANEGLTVEELNTGLTELLDAGLAIQALLVQRIRQLDERIRRGDSVTDAPYGQNMRETP
jgi:hypothetical protein